jgi:NAD(P)-dependent dehydrogenase (short-subunit alcohol dehydrogenase family)
MSRVVDNALDLAVLPGFSRLGFAARGLDAADAPAGRLDGGVALVTGASSGIGEAACEGLAAAGAEVHMLVRDLSRGAVAAARVRDRVPDAADRIHIELCDVSDLGEVRRFAESFNARRERLDVLVNNAGVLPGKRQLTRQGHELAFATNVLGPFLLTGLLLAPLRAAAPSRVITVSSGGMYTARLDADDPQLARRDFDGTRVYAHTKRAQVALNREWAARHPDDGIAFLAMHPGWARTPGLERSLPRFERLMRPLLRDARQGADTVVWLATAPGLDPPGGGFWHDRRLRPEHRVPWTRETEADRERLWQECERLTTLAARPRTAAAAA